MNTSFTVQLWAENPPDDQRPMSFGERYGIYLDNRSSVTLWGTPTELRAWHDALGERLAEVDGLAAAASGDDAA